MIRYLVVRALDTDKCSVELLDSAPDDATACWSTKQSFRAHDRIVRAFKNAQLSECTFRVSADEVVEFIRQNKGLSDLLQPVFRWPSAWQIVLWTLGIGLAIGGFVLFLAGQFVWFFLVGIAITALLLRR